MCWFGFLICENGSVVFYLLRDEARGLVVRMEARILDTKSEINPCLIDLQQHLQNLNLKTRKKKHTNADNDDEKLYPSEVFPSIFSSEFFFPESFACK